MGYSVYVSSVSILEVGIGRYTFLRAQSRSARTRSLTYLCISCESYLSLKFGSGGPP